MNQQTSTQNHQDLAKRLTVLSADSNPLHPNSYRINGLQLQNQDKSPPGGWRSPESHQRLKPDRNSNRSWQQKQQ